MCNTFEQTKCSRSSVDLSKTSQDEGSGDQVGSPDSLHSDVITPSPTNTSCFITQVGVVT